MATSDFVHHVAFPKLTASETERLAELAKVCSFKDGETHFPGRTARRAILRRRVRRDRDRG